MPTKGLEPVLDLCTNSWHFQLMYWWMSSLDSVCLQTLETPLLPALRGKLFNKFWELSDLFSQLACYVIDNASALLHLPFAPLHQTSALMNILLGFWFNNKQLHLLSTLFSLSYPYLWFLWHCSWVNSWSKRNWKKSNKKHVNFIAWRETLLELPVTLFNNNSYCILCRFQKVPLYESQCDGVLSDISRICLWQCSTSFGYKDVWMLC